MSLEVIETHSIIPYLITQNSTVIDCGANLGLFSLEMTRRFGCECYAIEAVSDIFEKIPNLPRLHRFNFALCATNGPVTMFVDKDITRNTINAGGFEKSVSDHVVVQGRRLDEFLAEQVGTRAVDLVKMDIEGAEIEVLDSLDDDVIKRVGQWTIEFHDFLGYSSLADVEKRVDRIARLGFFELYWSSNRNTGDVLLVNKNRFALHRFVAEQYFVRPVRAGIHAVQRLKK